VVVEVSSRDEDSSPPAEYAILILDEEGLRDEENTLPIFLPI